MSRVLVPLAQGCEELEAVTIMDLLVRAGVEVVRAGLTEGEIVASRGTRLLPDTTLDQVSGETFDMIVLPGGLPGADQLRDDATLRNMLLRHAAEGRYLAAICAAPKVLANAGLLRARRATAYPGALDALKDADIEMSDAAIEIDGNIITSRGPGTAMDFSLELISLLEGDEVRQRVSDSLVR